LKQIIKNRFAALKKDREEILRRRTGRKGPDWEAELDLDDDGKIKPILSNLILILCNASKWVGVLAYDEFGARVIIRKRPPWGAEPIDAPWTDYHDTQARVWFQHAKINPACLSAVGRDALPHEKKRGAKLQKKRRPRWGQNRVASRWSGGRRGRASSASTSSPLRSPRRISSPALACFDGIWCAIVASLAFQSVSAGPEDLAQLVTMAFPAARCRRV